MSSPETLARASDRHRQHGKRADVPLVAAVALGDSAALVVSLLSAAGVWALLARRPV